MKIHEYNEMMAYLTRPGKAQGGVIGKGGMFQGEDMGYRTGFKKIYGKGRANIEGVPTNVGTKLAFPKDGKAFQISTKGNNYLFKTEKQAVDFYNKNVKKGSGAQIKNVWSKQSKEIQEFFKDPKIYKRYYDGPLNASSIENIWLNLSAAQKRQVEQLLETKTKNIKETAKLTRQGYMQITDLADELGRTTAGELIQSMKNSKKFNTLFPNYLDGMITASNNSKWIKTTPSTLTKLKQWANDPQSKGLADSTIKNIQTAYKDKELMNYWKTWKPGTPIDQELVDSIHGKKGSAYTMMQLGRTLQGKEPIDGVRVNKALGDKIIDAVRYKAKEFGDWHTAAYRYAKQDMDTFLPPGKSGTTFGDYQKLISKALKDVGLEGFEVDEINALRSGVSGGTQPYSVFSQVLEGKYNRGVKRRFDGENAKNQMKLNKALAMGDNETIKVSKKVLNKEQYIDYVIKLQNDQVDNFFTRVPELKNKISLPKFDLRDPKTVYGSRFDTFDKGVQNAILKNFKEVGFTVDVGKKALTQKELLSTVNTLLNSADKNQIMKIRKILGCMSEGGRVGLQGGGNLLECPMKKFAENPEAALNKVGQAMPETRTPIINAFKNFGAGTLKWGGRVFVGLTPIFAGMEIADASRKYEEGVPSGQIAMDAFGNWVIPGAGGMYKTYQDRKMMKDIASPQELAAMEKEDDRRYYNMLQEDPLREADYSKKLEETQTTPEEQLELFKLMEKQKAAEYWNQQRRKGERAKLAEESTDTFSDFRDYAAAEGGRAGYRIGGLVKLYETAKKVYPLLKSGAKEELAKLFNILKKNTITVKRGESGTTGASGQSFPEYKGKYWNPPEGGFEGAAADARFYSKLGGKEGKPKVLTAEITPEELIEGKRLRGLDTDDPEIGDIILPESAENKVKIDYLNTIRARIEKILGMAEGGRVGFDEGSKPKSPSRRAFLKGITALAALPLVGKYFKLGKVLEKAQPYLGPTVEKIKGMPEWFPGLVKKLWNEGEDVTKTYGYENRLIVKKGTLEGGDEVNLYYHMDSGDVTIDVAGPKPVPPGDVGKGGKQAESFRPFPYGETSSGSYNQPYALRYKVGQMDETTKGKKPPDEFTVDETEMTRSGPEPDDVDWYANETNVDDAISDLTELEAFAKNKTIKQIHKKKGTKPKNIFPEWEVDWDDVIDPSDYD